MATVFEQIGTHHHIVAEFNRHSVTVGKIDCNSNVLEATEVFGLKSFLALDVEEAFREAAKTSLVQDHLSFTVIPNAFKEQSLLADTTTTKLDEHVNVSLNNPIHIQFDQSPEDLLVAQKLRVDRPLHSATVFGEVSGYLAKNKVGTTVYAGKTQANMSVAVYRDGKLEVLNMYPINDKAEYAYYLMMVFDHLQLDAAKADLNLFEDASWPVDIVGACKKYIRNVSIAKMSSINVSLGTPLNSYTLPGQYTCG